MAEEMKSTIATMLKGIERLLLKKTKTQKPVKLSVLFCMKIIRSFNLQVQSGQLNYLGKVCRNSNEGKYLRLGSESGCFEIVPIESDPIRHDNHLPYFTQGSNQSSAHGFRPLQMSPQREERMNLVFLCRFLNFIC